jgi:RimJ/RimL family protein N-acetyltransferase
VLSLGGFVVPDRRGLGLIGEVKAFAARHFLAQGYRRMVGVVSADNSASLKAFSRLGAKPLETLTRARIGRINLVWRSRALPRAFGRDRPLIVTL